MKEINKNSIEQAINIAELKSNNLEPDNSAPLMTHDIEGPLCTGLQDCPVYELDKRHIS